MKKSIFAGIMAALIMSGCGGSATSSSNISQLSILSNQGFPTLNAIVSIPGAITPAILAFGFSSSNPYWVFNNLTSFGSYTAPANGIVSDYNTTTLNGVSLNYITILHSGRLATRLIGIQVPQVRPGDLVYQGQALGAFINTGQIGFQVIVDGSPVCPLSYMSQGFRQYFTSYALNPCL